MVRLMNLIRDLYRGVSECKVGYRPTAKLIKDEKDDQLADSHSVLNRWRNYFCQLLNVQGDNDVRQTAIHTAEPLVPEPSTFDVEMATEKLKRYKSRDTDQMTAMKLKVSVILYRQ
jgi:hypothetical protein